MKKTVLACTVCGNQSSEVSTVKFGVTYAKCLACDALFTGPLDPGIVRTQNDDPAGRAEPSLQEGRLNALSVILEKPPGKLLDFGCGQGEFVEFMKSKGVDAVGVDQTTQLTLSDIAPQSLDAITMIEVIEHLDYPETVLQQLKPLLKPNGIIHIESCFANFIEDTTASAYVDPLIGHCCIHSLKSIDYLSRKVGMKYFWIHKHLVIMRKPADTPAQASAPSEKSFSRWIRKFKRTTI